MDELQFPRPVEIVGTHWIHRDPADQDARFYRREEVDAWRKRFAEDTEAKLTNLQQTQATFRFLGSRGPDR